MFGASRERLFCLLMLTLLPTECCKFYATLSSLGFSEHPGLGVLFLFSLICGRTAHLCNRNNVLRLSVFKQ